MSCLSGMQRFSHTVAFLHNRIAVSSNVRRTMSALFELPQDTPAAPPQQVIADLLDDLNPQQRAAVEHSGSPLLVVAGAGSGKTRVLTRRIAYLLAARSVHPGQIMAITFTNKAAAEMKERVAELVGRRANAMWVST